MAQATIGADINQSLDIHRHFFAKITFDVMVTIDSFTQLDDLIFAKILHANCWIDAGFFQNQYGRGTADAEYIRQPNIDPFIPR